MYESCRYNKALVLDSYPAWCGLFNKEHLKVLKIIILNFYNNYIIYIIIYNIRYIIIDF